MRRFLVLIPLLALAVRASAQSDPTLTTKTGYWKPADRNLPAGEPADGPDLEPFAANLNGVLAVLRHAPVLAQPRGFVAAPLIDRELGRPRAPFLGLVRVTVLFLHHDEGGSVVPEDAGPQIDLGINDPNCVWQSHEVAFVDSAGSIYYDAPRESVTVHGVPGYSSDSSCLVIARRGVPVFAVVTKERFLRNARDTLLARVRAVAMAADPRVRSVLDTVRALAMHYDAELKAMPAAERRAPAWVKTSDAGVQDLAAAGAADARQLVAPNPNLFNPGLPRSAIQLMTVQAVVPGGDEGAVRLFEKIRETLDFAALAALLR